MKHINFVYRPPRNSSEKDKSIEKLYQGHSISSFSLARFALLEGLKLAGLKTGDSVLIPAFICRDVLACFNSLGAKILYYHVDELLNPVDVQGLPEAKVFLLVNYFGFPADLAKLNDYRFKGSTIIIEDNAHGFLSRDKDGALLGTRTDFGIISLRKSLPIPNGGVLITKNKSLTPLEIEYNVGTYFKLKSLLRYPASFFGGRIWQLLTQLLRSLRKLRTGYEIAPTLDNSEQEIPGKKNPCDINFFINKIDLEREISRRCELYNFLEQELGNSIYGKLNQGIVPLGYPFYAEGNKIQLIRKKLKELGLECYQWPALPSEVTSTQLCMPHYKNVWCVRFLW